MYVSVYTTQHNSVQLDLQHSQTPSCLFEERQQRAQRGPADCVPHLQSASPSAWTHRQAGSRRCST